ncbi:hypothetical protein ACCO45_011834 [Purpureocillium lilacinum]|uniref:Uncharacterized protein n=1 Tax=Purpureocillium lilacinum TaxID=33203 RepID=A0ACC4DCM7_PURLI
MFAVATAAALISLLGIAFAQQDAFDCPSDLSSGQYDSYTYFEVSGRCSDAGVADYCCVTFMRPSSPLPLPSRARPLHGQCTRHARCRGGRADTEGRSGRDFRDQPFQGKLPKGRFCDAQSQRWRCLGVALDEFRDKTGIKDSFIPSRVYLTARKSGDWEDTIMVDFHC